MFCCHCGKEIKDDSVYCNYCGSNQSVEEEAPAVSLPASKRPGKNRVLLWSLGGVCLIVVAVLAVLLFSKQPVLTRFQNAIEGGDAETAAEIFLKELQPDDGLRKQAQAFVEERAAALLDAYRTEADYEGLMGSLEQLQETGIAREKVTQAVNKLETACQVDRFLQDQEGYLEDKTLFQAISLLNQLQPGDRRYDEVQGLLVELKNRDIKEITQKIDSYLAQEEYQKAQEYAAHFALRGYETPESYSGEEIERQVLEKMMRQIDDALAQEEYAQAKEYVNLFYEKGFTPPEGYDHQAVTRRIYELELEEQEGMGGNLSLSIEAIHPVQKEGIDANFVEILFKNNSSEAIQSFHFGYTCPVPADAVEGAKVTVSFWTVGQPIQPGEVYGKGVYWYVGTLEEGLPDGGVQVCIESVNFFDREGSINRQETNNGYRYWQAEMTGYYDIW